MNRSSLMLLWLIALTPAIGYQPAEALPVERPAPAQPETSEQCQAVSLASLYATEYLSRMDLLNLQQHLLALNPNQSLFGYWLLAAAVVLGGLFWLLIHWPKFRQERRKWRRLQTQIAGSIRT